MDRLPLYYLCNRARDATEVRFHARDVSQWLGVKWRDCEVMDRLQRVLECRIDLKIKGGRWLRMRIAEPRELDRETGEIRVVFAPEFRRAVHQGIYYSLDVVRRLGRKLASVDLYLMLRILLRKGKHRAWWRVDERLHLSKPRYKAMSDIRKRLASVREAWPECPFEWVPRTLKIQCSEIDFRSLVFSRDERAEQRRIDKIIDSKPGAVLDAYLDRISPDMARRIKERYVERTTLEHRWTRPLPPDVLLEIKGPNKRDQTSAKPKRRALEKPGATPRVVKPAQPPTPRVPSTTSKADKPAQTEATKSASIFDKARAQMERVKRLGDRIRGLDASARSARKKRAQRRKRT